MARKRTNLGADADAQILARMKRGESPKKIHEAFAAGGGPVVSERTIARRMAELRPEVKAARASKRRAPESAPAPALGPPLPETPDEIPSDASLELLEHYRTLAKEAIDTASDLGDLKLLAQLINTAGAVEDRIQRRQPRPAEDINDQPDMVALGKLVEERFVKMVDMVLEQR